MQVSVEFGEANCTALVDFDLFKDTLGDFTTLLYVTCFAVIIASFAGDKNEQGMQIHHFANGY